MTPPTTADIMTLGELTAILERLDAKKSIRFDFGSLAPDGIDSYRGYYEQLAIGYSDDASPTVGGFLAELREANGKTFTGYKGGEYVMGRGTPLWVSNYGRSSGCAVVETKEDEWSVVLVTAMVDR